MNDPQTLTELLNKWRSDRIVLIKMIRLDYGADSPERNKTAYVMERQLAQCIRELETIINASPINKMIMNITNKENDADSE